MMKTLMLLAVAILVPVWGVEEAPKPKPIEDALWEKALADNGKEAEKAYNTYQKTLDAASLKVIKALEANIKDLNDSKKFGNLGMKERAAAITALEAKIEAVKKGAIGEAVVAKANEPLLGEKPNSTPSKAEVIIIKAIYGTSIDDGIEVTGGRIRIPHATWKKADEDISKKQLWIRYTKGGKERTISFPNGHLFEPEKDL